MGMAAYWAARRQHGAIRPTYEQEGMAGMPLKMCHLSAETVACEPCISLSIVCRAEPVHDMETGAPCALPQARNRLISWQGCLASDLVYTCVHVAFRRVH